MALTGLCWCHQRWNVRREVPLKLWQQVFDKTDADGSGSLDCDEFVQVVTSIKHVKYARAGWVDYDPSQFLSVPLYSVSIPQARAMFLEHAQDFIDLPRFMQVLEHYNLTWGILYEYHQGDDEKAGQASKPGDGGEATRSRALVGAPSHRSLRRGRSFGGSRRSFGGPRPRVTRQRSFSSDVVHNALRAAASIRHVSKNSTDAGNTELGTALASARGLGTLQEGKPSGSDSSLLAAVERHRKLVSHSDSFSSMQAGLRNADSVRGARLTAVPVVIRVFEG